MTKVIAAIDDTPAARAVLQTAAAVARLFDSTLAAAHVGAGTPATASRECETAGVPLRVIHGDVVRSLVALGRSRSVEALVLGTRDTPSEEHPVGSTALEVIEGLDKPVVVVPPRTGAPERIRRVLLPLDGTSRTALAPASVLELARDADVNVLVVHVMDEAAIPLFTDQPQHETEAWTNEFLERYCPHGLRSVELALRVGRPDEVILGMVRNMRPDLVVLGWNRQLAPGRAHVVRALLARGDLPLLLVPSVPDVDERRRVA